MDPMGMLGCLAGSDRHFITCKLVYFTYLRDVNNLREGLSIDPKYQQDIPVGGERMVQGVQDFG